MNVPAIIAAALTVGIISPAAAEPSSAISRQEARQTAEALIAQLDAAYNRHDAAGIASLFAEDATLVPARPSPTLGAVLSGRLQIEKFFAHAVTMFGQQTETVVDAGPIGDAGIWLVTELHLAGHGQLEGHVGGVLVRSGNGWQIRMSTVSARPPGASTAAAPAHQ